MKLFKIPILDPLFFVSCKEEYFPKVKSTDQSVLVVEGILNSGLGPTTIKLTRTFKLDDTAKLQAETGAQLFVEGSSGSSFPLYEIFENGTYTSNQLQLDPAEKYRLHITTSDGKEYVSDDIAVKQTPSIDSISWERKKEGVQIYVNAHDAANATRYYKWDYEETWEFHSAFVSVLKYVNGEILPGVIANVCLPAGAMLLLLP